MKQSSGLFASATKQAQTRYAVSVSARVMELIANGEQGRVHSVFTACINVIIGHENLITIGIEGGISHLPYCLLIDNCPELRFDRLGLRKDMEVNITSQEIAIPEAGMRISLENVLIYESKREPIKYEHRERQIRRNLDAAWQTLKEKGKKNGLGCECVVFQNLNRKIAKDEYIRMDLLCRRGVRFIKELIHSIEQNNTHRINSLLKELIGLGIGLTPSADDVIAGIACSLFLAGRTDFSNTLSTFLASGNGMNTTLVSRESLKHIVGGEMSDAVYNMVQSVLMTTEKEVVENTEKVIKYGSASGTETAMGILLGVKLALKMDENSVKM